MYKLCDVIDFEKKQQTQGVGGAISSTTPSYAYRH